MVLQNQLLAKPKTILFLKKQFPSQAQDNMILTLLHKKEMHLLTRWEQKKEMINLLKTMNTSLPLMFIILLLILLKHKIQLGVLELVKDLS